MTRHEFCGRMRGELAPSGVRPDHGYDEGRAVIDAAGGELVSVRRGTDGSCIETFRVRCDNRDVLLTWGLAPPIIRPGAPLSRQWRIV